MVLECRNRVEQSIVVLEIKGPVGTNQETTCDSSGGLNLISPESNVPTIQLLLSIGDKRGSWNIMPDKKPNPSSLAIPEPQMGGERLNLVPGERRVI
jgi:hypothetical protein